MEQPEKIKLYESRDFGANLETTLAFIKQNYGAILKSYLIFIPIILIAMFLMLDYLTASVSRSMGGGLADLFDGISVVKVIVALLLISVSTFFMVLYPVCYMGLYSESKDGIVNSSEVWSMVFRSAFPIFGYSIIYGILVMVGLMFCFIPGIIVAVYLYFYMYIYIIEKKGLVETFQRSYDLVKNNWWATFGLALLIAIILWIISFIFSIPAYLTVLGPLLKIDFFSSDIYIYVTQSASYVASLVISPISYIAMGIMYFNLRNKVDGTDLEDEIDNIGYQEKTQY